MSVLTHKFLFYLMVYNSLLSLFVLSLKLSGEGFLKECLSDFSKVCFGSKWSLFLQNILRLKKKKTVPSYLNRNTKKSFPRSETPV